MLRFVVIWFLGSAATWACSVPVFRYALERWTADDYVALVFHRGELTGEQAAWVRDLGRAGTTVNLSVRCVDLASAADHELGSLAARLAADELPSVVLLYPRARGISTPAWQEPLTGRTAGRLLDSPLRREIAARLLKGDCAVWALLESGDAALDTRAQQVLDARLRQLETTLRLPELDPADVAGAADTAAKKLAVRFSSVRIRRDDPAEAVLAGMLAHTEDDLAVARQPIVFPIFGRGRVLYALVGPGINDTTIKEAAQFVTGACSCVIKDENPGTDLLMAVDWAAGIEPLIKDAETPPLAGLASFGRGNKADAARIPGGADPTGRELKSDTPAGAAASRPAVSPLLRGLAVVGSLGGGILIAATWWLLRARGG